MIMLPKKYDFITLKSVVDLFNLNYTLEQVTELADLKFADSLTLRERIDILKSKLPTADFEYTKSYECNLTNLIILSDIIENEYSKILNEIEKSSIVKPPKSNTKQTLTFYQLFKTPYNKKLDQFKINLKNSNLIDDEFKWREVDNNGNRVPIQDIGKFYNWLYSETTVFDKTADKTAHCICFCGEFGIFPYEGKENKPGVGRTVTAKLIRETTFDNELELKYINHFKAWINKEK